MKILFLILFLAIVIPSLSKPIEEEEEVVVEKTVPKKKVDNKKLAAIDDDDDFDKDEDEHHHVHHHKKVDIEVKHRPVDLHIDIPPFFNLKLFTGSDGGHSLGIGVFPGFHPITIIKEKEKEKETEKEKE